MGKKKRFVPPTQQACLNAIGVAKNKKKGHDQVVLKHKEFYEDTKDLKNLLTFLNPANGFEPIRTPASGDWLDEFEETGQPFHTFAARHLKKPSWEQDTIFLLPLGDFSSDKSKIFCKALHEFASIFFGMKVKMLDSIDKKITRRPLPYSDNPHLQYLTKDLLKLIGKNLPANGYCAVGLTMEDLYPEDDWNFVFGQATLSGTGVFSFARYAPAFHGLPVNEETEKLLLERSLKVMVHEIAHIFGLEHCIHYQCIMNGSNSLEEEDVIPFHLCPVCLRKLHFSIGFDIKRRYLDLRRFFSNAGFEQQAQWCASQVPDG